MILTSEEIEKLLRKMYLGMVNPLHLPKKLYKKIADKLTSGVFHGFGKTFSDVAYDTPDFDMLLHLRENVYLFSAAKTFNYVLETEGLIVEDKKTLPFQEFKKRAKEVFDQYNENWLRSEYDTAIGQAQCAREWNDFASDAIVRYSTARDSHVSDVCRSLEGITRPKNDPFWNTHAPINHWRCRCQLITSASFQSQPIPKGVISPTKEFAFNPGIKKQVFDKSHPYFTEIPKKYHAYSKNNFDLPLPKPPKK